MGVPRQRLSARTGAGQERPGLLEILVLACRQLAVAPGGVVEAEDQAERRRGSRRQHCARGGAAAAGQRDDPDAGQQLQAGGEPQARLLAQQRQEDEPGHEGAEQRTDRVDHVRGAERAADLGNGSCADLGDQRKARAEAEGGQDHEAEEGGGLEGVEQRELVLEGENELGEEQLRVAEGVADEQQQDAGRRLRPDEQQEPVAHAVGQHAEHEAAERQAADEGHQDDGEREGGRADDQGEELGPEHLAAHGAEPRDREDQERSETLAARPQLRDGVGGRLRPGCRSRAPRARQAEQQAAQADRAVDRHRRPQRAVHSPAFDQVEAAGERAQRRAQGVQAIQPPRVPSEVRELVHAVAAQDRQRRPHAQHRRQQDGGAHAEGEPVIGEGLVVEAVVEDGLQRTDPGQQPGDEAGPGRDRELQEPVGRHQTRCGEPVDEAPGPVAAQPQASHEHGQDDADGVGRAPDDLHQHAGPEDLVDQAARAGQEEAGRDEPADAAARVGSVGPAHVTRPGGCGRPRRAAGRPPR